jgi:hypothetical protein
VEVLAQEEVHLTEVEVVDMVVVVIGAMEVEATEVVETGVEMTVVVVVMVEVEATEVVVIEVEMTVAAEAMDDNLQSDIYSFPRFFSSNHFTCSR